METLKDQVAGRLAIPALGMLLLACIAGCATGRQKLLTVPARDLGTCTELRNVRSLARPKGSAACEVLLLFPKTTENEASRLQGTVVLRDEEREVFQYSFSSQNWQDVDGFLRRGSDYCARSISGDTGLEDYMQAGKANALELEVSFVETPPPGILLAFKYVPWHWRLIP